MRIRTNIKRGMLSPREQVVACALDCCELGDGVEVMAKDVISALYHAGWLKSEPEATP